MTTIHTITDQRDKIIGAQVEAILARAGIVGADGKRVRAADSNPYRGHKLLDLARASLQRGGVRTDGMDQMRLAGAALSPSASGIQQGASDFPIVLEAAMNKSVQAAYATAPDTWQLWCKRGMLTDFRPHIRYRVGSFANLDLVPELAEYKHKRIPDGERSTVTAATRGNLVSLSRQAIINDDMSVFTDMGASLGRAAKRTVESDAYALLASNPILSDGFALFSTQHGNIAAAGGSPSVAAFDASRVQLAQQKDVSGNDYLALTAAIWLGPVGLGGVSRTINSAEFDTDASVKAGVPNKARGQFPTIVDTPRLAGLGWYTFADPNSAPVIEVAFLDGDDTPHVESQSGWTVDGTTWKVRLDYAVGAIDFRGATYNPGA